MSRGAGTGERQGYATALAGLWTGLSRTLAQLESLAAGPSERLADEHVAGALPRLQYTLHQASELAFGIDPPPGAESAHAELAAALADARDATGEIAEALEAGGPAVFEPLILEWRGALFRVRLARLRLAAPTPTAAPAPGDRSGAGARAALAATLLVLAGVLAFTVGAMAALWPVWAVGLALVASGFFVYRP